MKKLKTVLELLLMLVIFTVQESFCQTTSILYAIASKDGSVSPTCSQQLKVLRDAIGKKDVWGMKASDSSAQRAPGFILGNSLWLGNYKGCLATQTPPTLTLADRIKRNMKDNLVDDVAPFEMDFKVAHIRANSPWQIDTKVKVEPILHLGLCLPESCSVDDALTMVNEAARGGSLTDLTFLEARPQVLAVKDLNISVQFFLRPSFILFIALVIGNITMVFVFKTDSPQLIVRGFDLNYHIKALYTIKKSEVTIPVVKGFKTMLNTVIQITHVLFFSYFVIKDKVSFVASAENPDFQIFAQMPVLFEAIFIMDGFLSCNSFLKNEKLMTQIRTLDAKSVLLKFSKRILKRYCRMMPLNITMMILTDMTSALSNEISPFYLENKYHEVCPYFFWRNLLLIQNLFSYDEMCMTWSWSVACDMQCYVLVSAILYIYTRNELVAKFSLVSIWLLKLAGLTALALDLEYTLSMDVMMETFQWIYMSPLYRFTPYFLGTVGAWYLNTRRASLLAMAPRTEKMLWYASNVLFIGVIFSEVVRSLPTVPSLVIKVVCQIGYAFFVCWMMMASALKKKCWWSRILEKNLFQHFSKLGYEYYLLGPVLNTFVLSLNDNGINFDVPLLIILCLGYVLLTYLSAVVLHLFFEAPYLKIFRVVFQEKIDIARDQKDKKDKKNKKDDKIEPVLLPRL